MKKLLSIVIALITTTFYAQNTSYKISKSEVFEDNYKNSVIILSEINKEEELLLVRSYKATMLSQSTGFYIEYYNNELKFNRGFDFKMKHPLNQKFNLVLGVFHADKKTNIIEIYYDLNEKTHICQNNIIDENFNVTKKELFRISKEKLKELGSFNLKEKFYEASNKNLPDIYSGDFNTELDKNYSFSFFGNSEFKKVNKSDISIVINKNKSAYAIILDYKNKDQEGFLLYLFNANSEEQFFKDEQINTKEKDFILQNFQVAENGKSVYILSKNYSQGKKKIKYSFEISEISALESKIKTIEIENKFIKSLKLNFYNNFIYCIGFYSEKSYKDNDGICFFKFNLENLASEKIKFSPFSKQFIEDKFGKESDEDITDLKIKTILFENNNIILNAEEVYNDANHSSNGFAAVNVSTVPYNKVIKYSFNDIVSAKLNTDGDLIWSRNINKKQSYTYSDDSFVSYFSTIKNGASYFFINASEKIKELKNDRIAFKDINPTRANLYLLTIDTNGLFNYQLILEDESTEVSYIVSKGTSINNSNYFLGKRGKTKQLLKVTL